MSVTNAKFLRAGEHWERMTAFTASLRHVPWLAAVCNAVHAHQDAPFALT